MRRRPIASPEMHLVAATLMKARTSILDQIKVFDRRLPAVARATPVVRLFMAAPGVGVITALSVASVFDDALRFRRSSRAGAYLGLTPRRSESGETRADRDRDPREQPRAPHAPGYRRRPASRLPVPSAGVWRSPSGRDGLKQTAT